MKKVYEEATLELMDVAKRDIIITSGGGSLDDAGGNDSGGNTGGNTGGGSGGNIGGGDSGLGGSGSGGGFDLPMDGF